MAYLARMDALVAAKITRIRANGSRKVGEPFSAFSITAFDQRIRKIGAYFEDCFPENLKVFIDFFAVSSH